jgi:hypothetical protein
MFLAFSAIGLVVLLLLSHDSLDDNVAVAANGIQSSNIPAELIQADIPDDLYPTLSSAFQSRVDAEYQVKPADANGDYKSRINDSNVDTSDLYIASTPSQGILTTFTTTGIYVTPEAEDGDWTLGLKLDS